MENNLFRKNSLENISSPERLNEYIKITNPGIWSLLAGCIMITIAVGMWGFYGSIPETVKASGIIFPQNGVTAVIPVAGGRISDMRVKVGDFVEAGQILAVIPQEKILSKIKDSKNKEVIDTKLLEALYSEYESQSLVVSPVSGIILGARSTNETVSSEEAVVQIVKQEKYSDSKQIVCFVPSGMSRKLKEGMEVQVSPDFAPREEYGYMYGHLTSIGTYPVTQDDVLKSLGNLQYAEGLLPKGNCVEVRITLTVDPNSQSKIKWSNKKGESILLTIGTYNNLLIVVKNNKPYQLVFK